MTAPSTNPLVTLVIEELPSVVDEVRSLFAARHPTDPLPTDADVKAAFDQAFQSSLAKDEAWLAAHPTGT